MTKPQTKQSLTYLKFLSLVSTLRSMPAFPVLEPIEEHLLNAFAAAWHMGKQLTVLEAMQISTSVSSATVHRRLKTLRTKGYLELSTDASDSRIKYLLPTPQAIQYFTELGACLSKASIKE